MVSYPGALLFLRTNLTNGDEFLWVNISYEVVIVFVMDTIIGLVKWFEYLWIGLYKLIDFPKICVIEIVTLDPKVPFRRLGKKFCFVCIGFGGFVV